MKKAIIPASLIALTFIVTSLHAEPRSTAVAFQRKSEPRENAFSLLVPRGWIVEGGAFRIMDERHGGAMNMIDCKFDFVVKSDRAGSVMARWMPEMLCIDTANAWGNPEGAIFNDALVRTKRPPARFITEIVIPYAHPQASGVTVKQVKDLPALASLFRTTVPKEMSYFTNMSYYAALVAVTYEENGRRYDERIIAILEDFGQGAGGLWKNRTTLLMRTPVGEFPRWERVFSVILNSGAWNMRWVEGEMRGQMQRQQTVAMTQQDLQRIDREIADGRRKTQEAIQRDMHLTLTQQDDYKNPFTGKIERDTSAWKYRWVNSSGDIIFSDDGNYDPNRDPSLKVTGFKRTPGRQ